VNFVIAPFRNNLTNLLTYLKHLCALEVFYENALYKFTFDIDIDIDADLLESCIW